MCLIYYKVIEFEHYKDLTYDFITKIYKMKIQFEFSIKTFQGFPNNLSTQVKSGWEQAMEYNIREFGAFISKSKIEPRTEEMVQANRIATPYMILQKIYRDNTNEIITTVNGHPIKVAKIDFEQLILEQQLTYFVGLIEGFLIESIQILFENKPDFLSDHDLELKFKEINALENFENIQKKMIEMAVGRSWSAGNFSNKIEKLRTKFGITLKFKKQLKDILDEANLLRNCILHNGSKVSSDYLDQFGTKRNITKGDNIKFSVYFLDALYYLSLDFVKELFIETSNLSWNSITKSSAEDWICGAHNSYYKDHIWKEDNYIFQELKRNRVL